MTAHLNPVELASTFADIQRVLVRQGRVTDAMTALTRTAVDTVPAAQNAGVTMGRIGSKFTSVAPTSEIVQRVDTLQYALRSGPCVDAVVEDRVFRANDLRTDPRWPVFGKAAAELGVSSMMAIRLYLPEANTTLAALNLYTDHSDAFDVQAETTAMLLATHGAMALAHTLSLERADNLDRAMDTNRTIGAAMGILMHQFDLSREQAFDVLRITSQDTNRKMAAIAEEVLDTGHLELPPRLRS